MSAQQRAYSGASSALRPAAGMVWVVAWVVAWLCGAGNAQAHPISLSSTFVDVSEDRVEMTIEIMTEDLVLYYAMDHDDDFRFARESLKERAEKHTDFLLTYLQLRDQDGGRVDGEVVEIDASQISDDGVHMDHLMAYTIDFNLVFALDDRPRFLSIFQNFGGDDPIIPAEMEVWVFQQGSQLEGPIHLSHGAAHTTEFNWDADIDTTDDDMASVRDQMRERQAEEFGITSYGSVYGYIYITETEIRHELLIPLLTLERWVDVGREDADQITVAEQRKLQDVLFDFLREHNQVEVNGEAVAPTLHRVDFFGPGIRDLAEQASERTLSVYNARVGVILSFATPSIPQNVEFNWHHFEEQMPYYRPRAYTFDDQTHDVLFDPYLTRWEWESEQPNEQTQLTSLRHPTPAPHIRLPILSLIAGTGAAAVAFLGLWSGPRRRRLVCMVIAAGLAAVAVGGHSVVVTAVALPVGAESADEDLAHETFQALHRNIYRAFELQDEEQIYKALQQSVAGPLLERLYLEVREGLTMQEQGGAVSRVSDVEVLESELRPVRGSSPMHQAYEYECVWVVTGTVEHWGHIHTRQNRYEAVFTVEGLLDEGWRVTNFTPLIEERVHVQTRLRN